MMRLRNKILVLSGLSWLIFFGVLFGIYQFGLTAHLFSKLPTVAVLGLFLVGNFLFFVVLLIFIYFLVIRRLEKLNQQIYNIEILRTFGPDQPKKDELASITSKINFMLAVIETANKRLEKHLKKNAPEFQTEKMSLAEQTLNESDDEDRVINRKQLAQLSQYDNLTTLPNRVFFNEILNKTIQHSKRYDKKIALLLVDFDRFKLINDNFGEKAGDHYLKIMGQRFMSILRAGDIIARLEGDEFMILLNDIEDPKIAGAVADKILFACKQPIIVKTDEISITASIGIAIFPYDGESLEDLQKHADIAMIKVKKEGGEGYQYYQKDIDTTAHEHYELEKELRNAIPNNEMVLYYQPLLNLGNGVIQAVEALMRWERPNIGLLNPDKFIHLAEQTNLIFILGEWALHEACRTNKSWQREGYNPVVVSVNISPKQFRHQDLAKIVSDALRESRLDPRYLEIEVTETTIMDNIDIAVEKLNRLHDLGVRIAIDDFGTGYTSLNYLRQFPVDVLKVDQTFIKGIPENQNDISITNSIITLGHNLELKVVAEGVETTEQIQYLAEHHCDLIQGYFLSRPLPATKIILQLTKKTQTIKT